MIVLALVSIGGLVAGILLLPRVPVVAARRKRQERSLRISVVIPARNEETNLPLLLESLRNSVVGPCEVLVVDDGSTDGTASVARRYGAVVIPAAALPEGWTGKTWACHQGALAAKGDAVLFLDADTRFAPEGYDRIIEYFEMLPGSAALSLLPFHRTEHWYEELSLFFNIVLAMGAGGFGKLNSPRLFGQALIIRREMYERAGGHASVKREILENLHFAANVRAASGRIWALGGRGTLEMRMFPEGFAQLSESWQKAFATGAGLMSPVVLGLSIYWLGVAMLTAIMLCAIHGAMWPVAAALYLLNVAEIAWFGRQLGTFQWLTALLYPVALVFYFATFAQSMWRQKRGGTVTWRGRKL